jgi:V/A-type H+-transporting ATPase subunit E
MEQSIQELTDRLYREGVEKGKREAEDIVERARVEARGILEKASAEAAELMKQASADLERTRERVLGDIKTAGVQSIALIRQTITSHLLRASLEPSIRKTLDDPGFMKEQIGHLIAQGRPPRQGEDLVIAFPEERKRGLEGFLSGKAKELLDAGLEISFDAGVRHGLVIRPKDGSYEIRFTDEDFLDFFGSFLKDRTKALLFGPDRP